MKNCAKMKPVHKVTEDYIFPHDLKMWAKVAGRKFKKAKENRGKKTRQGISSLSKGHKKYRGQGGRRKRCKA